MHNAGITGVFDELNTSKDKAPKEQENSQFGILLAWGWRAKPNVPVKYAPLYIGMSTYGLEKTQNAWSAAFYHLNNKSELSNLCKNITKDHTSWFLPLPRLFFTVLYPIGLVVWTGTDATVSNVPEALDFHSIRYEQDNLVSVLQVVLPLVMMNPVKIIGIKTNARFYTYQITSGLVVR